mmetsp:Transcript_82063/g.129212  ORF Transcript_82063/g.129212 Transcript_82063/m.129212 type:complete len:532 (-) Transcript_82063:215-1810(-)
MLTLEVTGESVADGVPLGALILDDKNAIGFEYDALQKVIVQLVGAINLLSQHVAKLQEDQEQTFEGAQALEQQLAGLELRMRECDDTCQQIRLQVGTMVSEHDKQPEIMHKQTSIPMSEVGRKDLLELSEKIADAHEELERARRTEISDVMDIRRKCQEFEETLHRHQDFFDGELNAQLTEAEESTALLKADLEALQKAFDESNARRATKVELADVAHRVHVLAEGQASNHSMLTSAQKQFLKLDGLAELVNENKHRMQEMWDLFGKESQELREWTATGFVELRSAVRSKMGEREAMTLIEEIQKDVREFGPFVSEAIYRIEVDLSHKAEASAVTKLEDILNAESYSSYNSEAAKTANKQTSDRHGMGGREFSPTRNFEGRDPNDTVRSSASGQHFFRAGAASSVRGGGFSRPRTRETFERSPPREPPTLVRVSPRRTVPAPPPRSSMKNRSMRGALGMPQTTATMGKGRQQQSAEEDLPDFLPLLSQQPGAHSGTAQPQASDYHTYDYRDDLGGASDLGDESRPLSRASN